MKSIITDIACILVITFSGLHCGLSGDQYLVGVSGGGQNGYGTNTPENIDPNLSHGLTGTWIIYNTEFGFTVNLTFYADGTYEMVFTGYFDDLYSGTYTVSGNHITFDGTEVVTYSISGDTLTLTYLSGNTVTYTRST